MPGINGTNDFEYRLNDNANIGYESDYQQYQIQNKLTTTKITLPFFFIEY